MLTSRFVFADLDRLLGTAFQQLELPGLTSDKGSSLLDALGVHGSQAAERLSAGDETGAEREQELSRRVCAAAEPVAAKLMLTEEDLSAAEAKAVAWLKEWEEKGAEGEDNDAEE